MFSNANIPNSGSIDGLTAWLAGNLGSGIARLYTNDVDFDPGNTPSDYTEAAFPGYIPILSIAWGTPYINSDGKAESDADNAIFTLASSSGSYTVYGLYITDSGGSLLLAVFPFSSPFVFGPESPMLAEVIQITFVSEL